MELFAATLIWNGDGKLTVFDKTQGVVARNTLCLDCKIDVY
jgi:hypothetical protein